MQHKQELESHIQWTKLICSLLVKHETPLWLSWGEQVAVRMVIVFLNPLGLCAGTSLHLAGAC